MKNNLSCGGNLNTLSLTLFWIILFSVFQIRYSQERMTLRYEMQIYSTQMNYKQSRVELFFSVQQFQPFKDNCVCASFIKETKLCNYPSQKAAEADLFCKLSDALL